MIKNTIKYSFYSSVLVILSSLIIFSSFARASTKYNAGGKTYSIEDISGKISFGFLWYPTMSKEQVTEISGIELIIAKDAKMAEGIFPIIILLHDLLGDRFSFYIIANKLARLGYIVYAPSIEGLSKEGQSLLYSNTLYSTYTSLLENSITKIEADKDISSRIKQGSIGIIAYGTSTLLLLRALGVEVTDSRYRNECKESEKDICREWIYKRLAMNSSNEQGSQSRIHESVKGIVLFFPEYGIFLKESSLSELRIPALVIENSQKDLYPFSEKMLGGEFLRTKPYEDSDLECTLQLQNVFSKICDERSSKEKKREGEKIRTKVLSFIEKYIN